MPVETSPNAARPLSQDGEQAPVKLSHAASLVLDIVRFLAAIVVAVGHYTLPLFSSGLPQLITAAAASVGVFFVLSGFVISYVTKSRESTLTEYFVDRASRLFSVVIPALCFTIVADLIRRSIDPALVPSPISDYALRIVASLTFTSQMWSLYLVPGSNDPFWSLSFEAFYYVMYGLGFYLRGWKRIAALSAVCLLGGPSILFLAPAWFFGCVLHDLYQRCRRSSRDSRSTLAAVLAIMLVGGTLAAALPHSLRLAFHNWNVGFNRQTELWGMHKGHTLFLFAAFPFGLLLIAALLLVERLHVEPGSRAVRALRFIADGTFPLYLFHLPMLFLIRSIWHYDLASRRDFAIILASLIVVCVLLGPPCNGLKKVLRRRLMKAFAPRP